MLALWWGKLPASNYPGSCFQRGSAEQGAIPGVRSAWESRQQDTSCLAAQSTGLVLVLIYRLVVPSFGTLSPVGVKESQALFLAVETQGEQYRNTSSNYQLVYILTSHL